MQGEMQTFLKLTLETNMAWLQFAAWESGPDFWKRFLISDFLFLRKWPWFLKSFPWISRFDGSIYMWCIDIILKRDLGGESVHLPLSILPLIWWDPDHFFFCFCARILYLKLIWPTWLWHDSETWSSVAVVICFLEIGSVLFCSVQFGSIRFGSVRFGFGGSSDMFSWDCVWVVSGGLSRKWELRKLLQIQVKSIF